MRHKDHTRLSKLFTVMAASLAVLGLGACSSSKPIPAALIDFKPSLEIRSQWTQSVDMIHAAPTTARVASGAYLLTAQADAVVAYDALSGAMKWRSTTGVVQAPLGLNESSQTALALVQGQSAVALDVLTGEVRWRSALPAEMRARPEAVGDVFVILTSDGRVVGLDQSTGRRRWAISRTLPALSVRGTGAIAAIGQDTAVVGLPGGKVLGLNPSSGQVLWEINLAPVKGVNEVERIADVLPYWVRVTGLGVCATSYRQRASCVDERGQITHFQDMNAVTGLIVNGSQWLAAEEDGSVKSWTLKKNASNAGQAPIDWIFDGLKARLNNAFQALAASDQAAFVHDNMGYLHVLSLVSGHTIARLNTGLQNDVHVSVLTIDGQKRLYTVDGKTIQAWLYTTMHGQPSVQ